MRNTRFRYALVVAAAAFAALGGSVDLVRAAGMQGSAVTQAVDFPSFWAPFRKAVLNDDMAAVEAMVNFPLKTKGELDDDPVKSIGKPAFEPFFRASLKEDANMRDFSGSTLDFVRADPVFPQTDPDGSGSPRIGSLVFQRQNSGWKLSMLYRPEAD